MEESTPLFDLIIICFLAVFLAGTALSAWLTIKYDLLMRAENYHITAVLRDAILALLGVFVIATVIGGAVLIINIIRH